MVIQLARDLIRAGGAKELPFAVLALNLEAKDNRVLCLGAERGGEEPSIQLRCFLQLEECRVCSGRAGEIGKSCISGFEDWTAAGHQAEGVDSRPGSGASGEGPKAKRRPALVPVPCPNHLQQPEREEAQGPTGQDQPILRLRQRGINRRGHEPDRGGAGGLNSLLDVQIDLPVLERRMGAGALAESLFLLSLRLPPSLFLLDPRLGEFLILLNSDISAGSWILLRCCQGARSRSSLTPRKPPRRRQPPPKLSLPYLPFSLRTGWRRGEKGKGSMT
mmetsp:Transcript_30892/g.48417  ORF Transcript_30892/g.48417 Transcript_30892/m.48417 type:complete len:276 (+) Transcript_30892:1464-2291(+)